ncbi:FAD-binding oxidoreductase [Allosphingosinicella flava]|uniref:FAD-binding oxidoreductase n=1 Tax=Allosphingosinicella flava TaxID=2771430 RepID=A0A7T2LNC4_9SPHN|nr:FAD-binding oxidoreductase [Sphingosinicella flava]QPQ56047.1 FAD-binding oxidoreductase [Sphingosinicella flava]
MANPSPALLARLADLLGSKGFSADAGEMAPWLTDWRGRFQGRAAALLSPSSTGEVAEIVRLCAGAGVPIVPQGGNTSMVGGATPSPDGDALILSLRRMNRIRDLSPEDNLAICEAGVILAHLHEAAEAQGRRFPLSLGAKDNATIGGLVSTNAGGTQVLRFGTMRGLVAGLEAVLPDGTIFDGLAPLKKDNRGYDLRHLLIGAEGTLGIVTAASLILVPAVAERAVAWVGLRDPEIALALLHRLEERIPGAIESFELVPAVALDLVLAHIPGARAPLAGRHDWHVLVEAAGVEAEARLAAALNDALGQGSADDALIAASQGQADALWRIRDSISEAERKDGIAVKHDVSVPVADMPAFMTATAVAVEGAFPGTRVIAFGHLGDGNVHFNVRAPRDAAASWLDNEGAAVTRFVHDAVVAAGGSISAEHGIGQMKRSELERVGDPARLFMLRAIKSALDPRGIMNPGKLVPLAHEPRPS